MLRTRLITAAIALPVALLVLLKGSSQVIMGLFALFVALGTYEVSSMLTPRLQEVFGESEISEEKSGWRWPIFLSAILAVTIFLFSSHDPQFAGRGMVLVGFLGSIVIGCFCSSNNDIAFARIALLLVSITYGAFPWLAAWELYLMGGDSRYLILLATVVWCGDTGAYFVGKYKGKRKLAPRMSPNKTWEGSIGGLLASLLGACLIKLIYGDQIHHWVAIVAAALVGGAFGQMGDLVESSLKRFSGVKDSGTIFPGHGGFLDRVDGLLLAAPVIWLILYLL
jgi:phosphatidate cytidylyltransferase